MVTKRGASRPQSNAADALAYRSSSATLRRTEMPYLIVNGERFALQIGENTLGGTGDAPVYLPPLEGLPALGAITHWPGAEPTIRRLDLDVPLAVNDEPIGNTPSP